MMFTSTFIVALSFVATGLCSPLIPRQNPQYIDVIVQKFAIVAQDITAYRHVVEKFPYGGSNESSIAALKDIADAEQKIVAVLEDRDLWAAIYPLGVGLPWYSFTDEEDAVVASTLTPVIQTDFKAATLALHNLQPTVKKLGCYDLLNTVYRDFFFLIDRWTNVMNVLAYAHTPVNAKDKATAKIYEDIKLVTDPALKAYQVGPSPMFGDEPTDNCQDNSTSTLVG